MSWKYFLLLIFGADNLYKSSARFPENTCVWGKWSFDVKILLEKRKIELVFIWLIKKLDFLKFPLAFLCKAIFIKQRLSNQMKFILAFAELKSDNTVICAPQIWVPMLLKIKQYCKIFSFNFVIFISKHTL